MPKGVHSIRHPRVRADISENARVLVLQLANMLHFRHSKICPNLLLTVQPIYAPKDSHCDNDIFIFRDVFTIHPTSFDYGSLLNVNEQMFH